MLDYLFCLVLIILCWIAVGCVTIWNFINGRPIPFGRKSHAWFNKHFMEEDISQSIRSYIASEFDRMLVTCRETQGSREEFRILEIGVGTGANFVYYPERNSVTIVENNPYYREYLTINLIKNPHVNLVKDLTSAEGMNEVPDGSMDCVVSTYTLCAVDNVDAVLREAKRVLRPGGCFLFVEPVRDPEDPVNFILQILASPMIKLCLGYYINRELLRNITAVFKNVQAVRCELASEAHTCFGIYTDVCLKPHIRGIAVK